MSRDEKHGKDAIAAGIDSRSGWDSSKGPRPDMQPKYSHMAVTQAQPGSLAEALENSSWKPKVPNRQADTTVDAASLTDVDGNRKPSHLYLAAALEENYRKRDREEGR